jgi:hypothetical protein
LAQLEETHAKHDFDFDNEDARNHELMLDDLASYAKDFTRSDEESYDARTGGRRCK